MQGPVLVSGDSMGSESKLGTATSLWSYYRNVKSIRETGINHKITKKDKRPALISA